MFKRVLLAAAVAAAVSAPAFAEVSISGSAEMDFFARTNNGDGTKDAAGNDNTTTKFLQEIAIVVNVDGKDKLDNGSTLSWRLAQKVATDWRFDSFGAREAWIAYGGDWGSLKFGNQWSNTYLIQDWPYASKGFSGTMGEPGYTGFGSGISYTSPSFGGFNLQAAYDFGNGNKDAPTAYEVTLQGAIGPVNLDMGYFAVEDGAPVSHGGSKGNNLTGERKIGTDAVTGKDIMESLKGGKFSNWIIGARGSIADVAIRAAVRNITSEVGTAGKNVKADQMGYLLSGTYGFGKNALSLGYMHQTAEKDGESHSDNDFDTIGFQWDYSLSKNTGAFLQIRHNMVGKNWADNEAAWQNADGKAGSKDNSTRILVGTWTGF
ncbi:MULTISPECIES: porin [Deefgea]|uniref:Porin n=1 Tax=Deefgea chitinilytica TaxID=570276 RepID=A0ABS2CFK7_9NEIS|nr:MULTISPECIES: porin [Deefgea]MBM5572797.1 porin [Deefgea chitinilytica]MBM9890034.1 porin [Deefgea sp. CFH1-16]